MSRVLTNIFSEVMYCGSSLYIVLQIEYCLLRKSKITEADFAYESASVNPKRMKRYNIVKVIRE